MHARCERANFPGFEYYVGRGIRVCAEWSDFTVFRDWAKNAGYRADLTIERLDVDGNYEPSNCIWADRQAQNENRRFVSKAPNGQLWCHIARDNGISDNAYRNRVKAGWPFHQAATWPMNKRRQDGNLKRAVYLSLNGDSLPLSHAAKRLGLSPAAIYRRAERQGITHQEALDQLAKV